MTTIESCRNIPPLTRFARAMARLLGIGACLGIGLSTELVGDKLPGYIANNQLGMPARLVLLYGFLLPLLLVPALTALAVFLRASDPRRLFTLESMARRLSPLVVVGLLPPLLHREAWKGSTLLFLVATLIASLLVYASLRKASFSFKLEGAEQVARYLKGRLPARLSVWLPWVLLGLSLIAIATVQSDVVTALPWRSPKPPTVTTLRQALSALGHGGLLGIPFVSGGELLVGTRGHRFIHLLLVAAAALPLYAWARPRLGRAVALVVAAAYLSLPPLVTIGALAPLPLSVAAGFFFLAAWAFEQKRWVLAVLASILMLAVHEQTAAWLMCLCCYWVARERQRATMATGLFLVLLGYFVTVGLFWLPSVGGIDPYGEGFRSLWVTTTPGMGQSLWTLVTNPALALNRWCEQRELLFWLAVVVPFALVPLKNSAWVLWALPFVWFGVVATGRVPGAGLTDGSVAHFVVLAFAAVVTKLAALGKGAHRQLVWANLVTWAFALVVCINQAGCLWHVP